MIEQKITKANAAPAIVRQGVQVNGPVHLLADKGCEPPFVVIERRPTKAFVWIANAPRGMAPRLQEFLNPNSPSVEAHGRSLARYLEAESFKAKERKDRLAAARWMERIANAKGCGG